MELLPEFLKTYGPLGLGWVFFGWLLSKVWEHFTVQQKEETAAKIQLAVSIDGLAGMIEEMRRRHGDRDV